MAKTDQFGMGGAQRSDVTSVQAPVQEQVVQSPVADIVNFAGSALSAFSSITARGRQGEKEEADAAVALAHKNASDQFLTGLQSAASSVNQVGGSSSRASNMVNKLTNETVAQNILSYEEILDLRAKALKLPSFKPLAEGSAEEVAKAKRQVEFEASPHFVEEASDSEQLTNRNKWDASRVATEQHRVKMEGHALKMAKLKEGSADYKEEQRKKDLSVSERATNLVIEQPKLLANSVAGLETKRKAAIADGVPIAQADTAYKLGLEQTKNSMLAQVRSIKSQVSTGLSVQGDLAEANINSYFDTAIKYAGSTEANTELEARMDNINLSNAIRLQDTSEDAQVIGALEKLAQGAGPLVLNEMTGLVKGARDAIKVSEKREDGGPPPNLDSKNKGTTDLYKGLQANLSNLGKTNSDGTATVDLETVSKQASGVLAYVADIQGNVDLAEVDKVVEQIATPGFGQLLRMKGGLNPQDLTNAQLAVGNYTADVAVSFQNYMRQVVDAKAESKGLGMQSGAHEKVTRHTKPTMSGLDIKWVNGQVIAQANVQGSRALADELTKTMNGPLTRAVNASANLNNSSPEAEFSNWLPQLWPAKYGEQEEEPSQKVVEELSPEEAQDTARLSKGQVIVDEEDNWFSANGDGTFTQIRSTPNAASR